MASHLTVTSKAPTGASTTRALNAQGGTEAEGGALGAFAAMLGGAQQAQDVKATPESRLESALNKLANLVLGDAETADKDSDPADPEAVAAAIDTTLPINAPIETKALFADLVNDLAALKKSLEAGETPDAELLKRIDSALEGLAAKFDLDLSAIASPSLADLASAAQTTDDGDQTTAARLAQGLASAAQALLASDAVKADPSADSAQLLQSLGDKLAKLTQALKSDAISASDLASLNLKSDSAADADLDAAISKLLAASSASSAATAEPVLGTPKLSLTETTLTGKPVDGVSGATATADTTDGSKLTPVLSADAKPDTGSDTSDGDADAKSDDDRKTTDAKPTAAMGAPVAEVRDDTGGTAQNPTQSARVDAAAPRVIQAGYQTSQQQLNLPQLAFELVRQVNDGNTRFQMRLDPPELGRIDVKLDIDNSGQVNARLVVEKSETLDLMQRDQRALERALQQAGLDSSKTNLEFSLKQNPFSGGQQGRDDSGQQFSLSGTATGDVEEAPPPTINLYRASLTASGVNIIA